jgi:hypothetical protein
MTALGNMDAMVRVLVILALVALTVVRLIWHFRLGMAARVTAIPPFLARTHRSDQQDSAAPSPVASARSSSFTARLLSATVWLGLNFLLGLALFGLPILEKIPLIWRLFAAVLVNFYLVPYARDLSVRDKR